MEAPIELVLPLFGEAAGANDEATLKIAARDQLLHQESGHDRLPCTRVVSEQKAQRLTRQHGVVHGRDLVW